MVTDTKVPTVVSVLNLKGGVGKTTITALLAREAAAKGLKVLAVDLDPQANLSQALMGDHQYQQFMDDKQPSIVELFNGYVPTSAHRPAPSTLNYADIIKPFSGKWGATGSIVPSRFDFSNNLIDSVRQDQKVLARFISSEMMDVDLILIDCAPTESILTKTAYHASRYILIPVRTEFFSTIGFPLMKESLSTFCTENRGHSIDVCGVIINKNRTKGSFLGPHHKDAYSDIVEKAQEYQWPIFDNKMNHSDGYPKMAKEIYPTWTRNAGYEFPNIAREFFQKINLQIN